MYASKSWTKEAVIAKAVISFGDLFNKSYTMVVIIVIRMQRKIIF